MLSIYSLQQKPNSAAELFGTTQAAPFPFIANVASATRAREFVVARSSQALHVGFRIEGKPNICPGSKPGDFREGLWSYDVVEVFLADSQSTRYEEFNFAPNGAWWWSAFSDYRVRDSSGGINRPQPEIVCGSDSIGWFVTVSINFVELQVDFRANSGERMNVCAIIGGLGVREHFSAASLDLQKPDFHRTEHFPSCVLVP